MPREKSFDPDLVLERAVELFWRGGYDGTSMTKLLAAMGISRQSLYDTFGDKHSLFLAAMDRYRNSARHLLAGKLEGPEAPLEGVRAGFEWVREVVLENPEHRSCFMANSALELGQRDPEVRERVAAHLGDVEGIFRDALERAEGRGEIAKGRDLRVLARLLTTSIHGLGIMARSGIESADLRGSVDATLRMV